MIEKEVRKWLNEAAILELGGGVEFRANEVKEVSRGIVTISGVGLGCPDFDIDLYVREIRDIKPWSLDICFLADERNDIIPLLF